MPIQFLCPHCKKAVKVKDEFAGKKGKCPHCTKFVTVPAPAKPSSTPPPPRPRIDVEAEAAAALADEPKPEAAAAPTTIDFTCPMCDAQLHMPLSDAGRRAQCPECKNIIKV